MIALARGHLHERIQDTDPLTSSCTSSKPNSFCISSSNKSKHSMSSHAIHIVNNHHGLQVFSFSMLSAPKSRLINIIYGVSPSKLVINRNDGYTVTSFDIILQVELGIYTKDLLSIHQKAVNGSHYHPLL